MARIALIVGHSQQGTYCEALAERYSLGAHAADHETRLFVLSRMAFDPILRQGYAAVQPLEPDLQAAYDALQWCDHAVFIFPLWCGDMPAILKGFFERSLQPDLVRLQHEGPMRLDLGIFPDTSARIIITMGMPALFYWLYFGGHAARLLRRNILQFVGMRPVRTTTVGMVGNEKRRQKALQKVEELGRAGR